MHETYLALARGERRGPLAALARAGLRLASLPYGLGVRARNFAFDRGWKTVQRAAVPVVSVGNLTLGGTGKTPCVEYVAGYFRDSGLRAAILSRGYGGAGGPNDEAMLLEENLPDVPHLQGADRADLAATAVDELESEVLVLDDGFQHRRLARDLDVVLIDATRPPAADHLFPRGTLREPAAGLRRAGAVLLTRCDQADPETVAGIRRWLEARFPRMPVADTEHRPTELLGGSEPKDVGTVAGRTVAAFCGIGNPASFRRTVQGLGAEPAAFRTFPDHHPYSRADVDDLRRWAGDLPADALVLTTQKDWVKLRLPDLGGRPLRAVRVGLTFRNGREAFDRELDRVAATCTPRDVEDDDPPDDPAP